MSLFINLLINLFIPIAVKSIDSYVKNSSSKSDDKILEVTKIGVKYLAEKHNNNVTESISNALNDTNIFKIQKSRL